MQSIWSVFKGLVLVAIIFGATEARAQAIPPDFKKAVAFVFLADTNGNLATDSKTGYPLPDGTGFFVGVKNDAGDGIFGYFVTAKHVLKDDKGNDLPRVFLRLNRLQGDAQYIALELTRDGKSVVYTSKDATADVAVVPVLPDEKIFDFRVLPSDMVTTKSTFEEFNIAEGTDAFFIGLFTTYYGQHKNNPIVRFGRIAMMPDDPIDWVDYAGSPAQKAQLYLIEAQSYGGNSGSPVFFSLGSDRKKGEFQIGAPVIKFAGVMRGRFNETNPSIAFLNSTTTASPITLPNIGIAAVTPAYYLDEILFSEALKKLRSTTPVAGPKPK